MTLYYGSVMPNVAGGPPFNPIPGANTGGTRKVMQSNVQIPNGAAANDLVYFGRIPSNALIGRGSAMYFDAITGVTSFHLGLYKEGSFGVPDTTGGSANCLMNAVDIHLAGSSTVGSTISPQNGGKHAWELAGYADDPYGYLIVVGKIVAGPASAAGYVDLTLDWRAV